MADPMLTSLCAICHVMTPRYKCPRCGAKTCSLGCIKKHKAWAECSGERDATTYRPPSKLRTPAGVDHDYNFLHGIEMSIERSEKLVVEEKGLVQSEELRPLTAQEVKWKMGRDGRKRKVLVTRVLREAKGRVFERFLAQKLKKFNVEVICAPLGMSRQKENRTTLNRRTGRINWQVEWLRMDADDDGTGKQSPIRSLSKVMDDVEIYKAYKAAQESDSTAQLRKQVKSGKTEVREPQRRSASSVRSSFSELDCAQAPHDSTWFIREGSCVYKWPEEQKHEFDFYLARPHTRSDVPVTLSKLEPADCLRDILRDTRVLEFPTIYVFRGNCVFPAGFVLGPKDSSAVQGAKRKGAGPIEQEHRFAKRNKLGNAKRGGREEGEIGGTSDGEPYGNGESADDVDDSRGAVAGIGMGLEAGEVIAEQSLGEDDDEEDLTSSSGSSSESEPESESESGRE